jgi:propane 2-monooxygenase small subunit
MPSPTQEAVPDIAAREISAAAGSKTFAGSDSRKYNYFDPKGRKATLYEDVTVDVQPDPDRYLIQDWILSFPDGKPTYSATRTSIKSSEWHKYRAPDQEWERNHYQRQAEAESTVKMVAENGRKNGAVKRFDKSWIGVLQNHVSALKHAEFGLGTVYMYGQRDGMTQMINNSILVNASYKLRFAQDLTLYLAEVGLDAEKFDFEAGKQHWLNDVIWQGARKAIESVLGAEDYLEQYFAGNLLFEPLVLELVRSGLIMQFAAAHGDFVTPTIVAVAEGDFERNLANTVELFQILLHDPKEAEHNRGIVQGWLEKHLTLCTEAANQLQPIWSQPRVKVTSFGEAYAAAKNRIETILSQIGADLPKGVQL